MALETFCWRLQLEFFNLSYYLICPLPSLAGERGSIEGGSLGGLPGLSRSREPSSIKWEETKTLKLWQPSNCRKSGTTLPFFYSFCAVRALEISDRGRCTEPIHCLHPVQPPPSPHWQLEDEITDLSEFKHSKTWLWILPACEGYLESCVIRYSMWRTLCWPGYNLRLSLAWSWFVCMCTSSPYLGKKYTRSALRNGLYRNMLTSLTNAPWQLIWQSALPRCRTSSPAVAQWRRTTYYSTTLHSQASLLLWSHCTVRFSTGHGAVLLTALRMHSVMVLIVNSEICLVIFYLQILN